MLQAFQEQLLQELTKCLKNKVKSSELDLTNLDTGKFYKGIQQQRLFGNNNPLKCFVKSKKIWSSVIH